jgi:hypothetical protein
MTMSFKPTDVYLGIPPLVGTLGRAEAEYSAALYVRVCQQRGNAWAPVTWSDVKKAMQCDLDGAVPPFGGRSPAGGLLRNPIFCAAIRPEAAIKLGFARWAGEDAFELTEVGFERLRRWVRLAVPS